MKVRLNYISGFEDAFTGMYTSKLVDPKTGEARDLMKISQWHSYVCHNALNSDGSRVCIVPDVYDAETDEKNYETSKMIDEFNELLSKVVKIGKKHITLLRFINFSFTVTGIHRGAQD